jgi:hypothetical protein
MDNQFIPWPDAATSLGISVHPHQLAKKMAKYPACFKQQEPGITLISSRLVTALTNYYAALASLRALQKGGKHGS